MSEALYKAVKSGKVKLDDLNDEGKKALKSYMTGLSSTVESPTIKPEVTPKKPLSVSSSFNEKLIPAMDVRRSELVQSAQAAATPKNDLAYDADLKFTENPIKYALQKLPGLVGLPEEKTFNLFSRGSSQTQAAATPDKPYLKHAASWDEFVNNIKSGNVGVEGTNARQSYLEANPPVSTGSDALDKAADVTGSFIGPLVGTMGTAPGKFVTETGKALTNMGVNFGTGVGGRILKGATVGAVTGAPLNMAATLTTEDPTAQELAQSANMGILYGGALGGGLSAAGAGLGAVGRQARSVIDDIHNPGPATKEIAIDNFRTSNQRLDDFYNEMAAKYGEGNTNKWSMSDNMRFRSIDRDLDNSVLGLNKFGVSDAELFSRPQSTQGPVLALPPGRRDVRMEAARNRGAMPGNETVIPAADIPANALPAGNYQRPQRLKVNNNNETLDYVMNQIKDDVQQDMRDIPIYTKAVEAAAKRGYDLPKLLEGQAPKVSDKVTRNVQERVAGVYPTEAPNIARPASFNKQVVSEAAPIVTRVGARPSGSNPKVTITAPQRRFAPTGETTSPVTPEVPPVQQASAKPRNTPLQERGFAETLRESDKTPQAFSERLKSMYKPLTNEETLAQANKRIAKDVEEATSFVLGKSRFSAEKATTAQRLIDHYNRTGNVQKAVDIAERVSEEATKAGQAIQALSMFNRLTPDGILVYAKRLANKTNEKIPVGMKEVKVTEEMAANLTNLAHVSQKMTGVKDLSNDVINILDRAKAGEKLSVTETEMLKRFVNESKQFIQETTRKPRSPKPPQEPKDKRVRDNVVSFLDAQEQAAKERLRARGIQISSTPLDVWADYAIIGAAKMGKGTIKFADWSEQMVKEIGEDIRPHLQQLYDRSREAFEMSTKKVSKETISQAEKTAEKFIKSALENKKIDDVKADSLRNLAQQVSSLSGEAQRLASQDLQFVLRELDKPTILKKISSTQTIGQLLNPKTQVRNALGNELFYRLERLNKTVSTPIDIVRSKITGGDRTVTFRTNNQGQYWQNWMRGLKAGWKGVNVNGLQTAYDLGSPAFKHKFNPMTYLEKSLGAALKSFDTAAYMRAYNNTIGELATLRAINEGQQGNKALIEKYIREASDDVMKVADEYGRYVTFQDNNIVSNGLVALKRGLNLKKDFGIGDLVLKYPKTPGALLMRALEYSPAGFLRSAGIMMRPWFKKEPSTAEATQALSRAMIGTFGLTGLGYYLMDKGVVTGATSKDKDIRELQRSAGEGQYQVNLSALKRLALDGFNDASAKLREGDLLYSYDWMQPISIAVSMGANIAKNIEEGKSTLSGLAGTAYNSAEGGLSTLTEQSVLSGLKRATQMYPGQTITDKLVDIVSDTPASFVATFINQIKQMQDNVKRETYSDSKTERAKNKVISKVPGLSDNLPAQYDTLGKQKETYQDNNAFNVFLNPGFASRYELSPEAKLIVDLIEETGDESLAPHVPEKKISIEDPNDKKKKISITLNGDMFSRYQQLQGEETKRLLIKKYKPEASQKSRINTMKDVIKDAGSNARKQLEKELKATR